MKDRLKFLLLAYVARAFLSSNLVPILWRRKELLRRLGKGEGWSSSTPPMTRPRGSGSSASLIASSGKQAGWDVRSPRALNASERKSSHDTIEIKGDHLDIRPMMLFLCHGSR